MPPPLQPALINFIIDRFKSIFYEPTSWAEATSAVAILFYCLLIFGGDQFSDREYYSFASLKLVSESFSMNIWIFSSLFVCGFKLVTVVSGLRKLRLAGAIVVAIWLMGVIFLTWKASPWSPLLAFPMAFVLFNFFAVFRHVRDWEKPLTAGDTL